MFTLFVFFGALKAARLPLQICFLSPTIYCFALLAVGNITGGESSISISRRNGLVWFAAPALFIGDG